MITLITGVCSFVAGAALSWKVARGVSRLMIEDFEHSLAMRPKVVAGGAIGGSCAPCPVAEEAGEV